MSDTDIKRRKPATAPLKTLVIAVIAVACIGLAACGSSKSSSSTVTNAASSTPAGATGTTGAPGTPGGAAGARGGRFTALRECLQKNGITLPKRTPGTGPRGGGLLGGAAGLRGPKLPSGVTRAQYQAALKKCGGALPKGRALFGSPGRRTQALATFAACMRQNGVNLPAPDTSGKGPIFDTKGLNTTSASFNAALVKCRNDLQRGAGPQGGSPPGGEAAG